ncbi:MAG: hypothetical protein HQL32_04885 [Planctomycetes bacterium]|nr:hypothetical protein [Planctomycetota bacterium]
MKFDQIGYSSGAYFQRRSVGETPGFQIDLLFIRDDNVVVIGEVKYQEAPNMSEIAQQLARNETLFKQQQPKYKNYTYKKALITMNNVPPHMSIDYIVSLDDLFKGV